LSCPRPSLVEISDVAHGLSLICRYTGQCDRFYSVAEHSVLCADLARHEGLSVDKQMSCLIHDAAEAYIGDINGPMKALLRDRGVLELDLLEDAVQLIILQGLGMDHLYVADDDVKRIDMAVLVVEAAGMMVSRGAWLPPDWPKPPKDWRPLVFGLRWHDAKRVFLDRYYELRKAIT